MSIDITQETVIPFSKIPQWTEDNLGTRVSPNTAHRWRLRGVRGIKLDTILIGGNRCTSVEKLQSFFNATTRAQDGDSTTLVSFAANSKKVAQAESYLAQDGI